MPNAVLYLYYQTATKPLDFKPTIMKWQTLIKECNYAANDGGKVTFEVTAERLLKLRSETSIQELIDNNVIMKPFWMD